MAIPKGITREDVLQAIRDYEAGVANPYQAAAGYDLVVDGRRLPPKAIVGFAARRLNGGRFLDPDADFSGGESRAGATRVLRDLAFTVVAKGQPVPQAAVRPTAERRDWTAGEIDVLLAAYLDLLHHELDGDDLVKRDVTRALEEQLPARTRGSLEYKLQNVSSVLYQEGLPWVDGYKPASNYQRALRDAVMTALDGPVAERERLTALAARSTPGTNPDSPASLEVPPPQGRPPEPTAAPGSHIVPAWKGALIDAANRQLGAEGEEWVVARERTMLASVGRTDLADRVEWVSHTRGDGLGYDVLSFTPDGEETWIEVKTTNSGRSAPFLITRNELAVWRANPDRYQLVRVFGFAGLPRLYRLTGPPDERLDLEGAVWEARPR